MAQARIQGQCTPHHLPLIPPSSANVEADGKIPSTLLSEHQATVDALYFPQKNSKDE